VIGSCQVNAEPHLGHTCNFGKSTFKGRLRYQLVEQQLALVCCCSFQPLLKLKKEEEATFFTLLLLPNKP
jgi:hypothetical protein